MKVLAVLALSFPVIVALQIAITEQVPYWKLDASLFIPLLPIVIIFTLVLIALLLRGGRITRFYFAGIAFVWTAFSIVHALRGNSAWFGLSLLAFIPWVILYGWLLIRAYQAPFIDSGQRWFEGAPIAVPRIHAELMWESRTLGPYSLAKIGKEGAYLVGPSLPADNGDGKIPALGVRIVLHFQGRTLESDGVLIRSRLMNKGSAAHGIGVQFKKPNRDLQKEIADFVESLRGEGYVV